MIKGNFGQKAKDLFEKKETPQTAGVSSFNTVNLN